MLLYTPSPRKPKVVTRSRELVSYAFEVAEVGESACCRVWTRQHVPYLLSSSPSDNASKLTREMPVPLSLTQHVQFSASMPISISFAPASSEF
jgi:hypothetical protein